MKYMLLVYSNEAGMQSASKAQIDQTLAAYGAYVEALNKAGVAAGTNRLQGTAAATTVRVANGQTKVLDGPYAETRSSSADHFIVDVSISTRRHCPWAAVRRGPVMAGVSERVRPDLRAM